MELFIFYSVTHIFWNMKLICFSSSRTNRSSSNSRSSNSRSSSSNSRSSSSSNNRRKKINTVLDFHHDPSVCVVGDTLGVCCVKAWRDPWACVVFVMPR